MNATQEAEYARDEVPNYQRYLHLQGHGDHFDEADFKAWRELVKAKDAEQAKEKIL